MDSPLPLRDIHLPEPNSWWPPAPGWWLLLLLLIVTAALIGWFISQHRQRAALRSAERQLKIVQQRYKKGKNSQQLLAELSELVRRAMISHFQREDAAALVGDDWLAQLDLALGTTEFSQGVGAVLARGPYQQQVEFEEDRLIALVQQLITKTLTPEWRDFYPIDLSRLDRWRRDK